MINSFTRLAAAVALSVTASAAMAAEPLVSVDWLEDRLDAENLVILDLRGPIGDSGKDDYLEAHIPGAVWSEYEGAWRTVRDNIPGLLPPVERLEAYLSEIGVGNDHHVVLVPTGRGSTDFGVAARVYWTLNYLGHDEVSILDGGWKAWADAGLPTESGEVRREPGRFVADVRPELLVGTPEVERTVGGSALLIDARPESFFTGEHKHPAARGFGHIPGAMWLDQDLFYDAEKERLKPVSKMRGIVPDSVRPDAQIVSYCNTAHWAATNWFVLHELLGYENVTLYDESMVGWTADPNRPVDSSRTRLDELKDWLKRVL